MHLILVEIGIKILSHLYPLSYETIQIYRPKSHIGLNKLELNLSILFYQSRYQLDWKTDHDSARIPINEYIIRANNNIIAKLCTDSPSGLLRGSIRPRCIPEDSLADKILTQPPLSPEIKALM